MMCSLTIALCLWKVSKLKRIKCLDSASLVGLLDMIYVQELALLAMHLRQFICSSRTFLLLEGKGQWRNTYSTRCAVLTSCSYPGALGQFLPPAQGPFPSLEEGETRPQHRDKLSSSSTVGHRSPKSSRAWLPPSQVSDPKHPLLFFCAKADIILELKEKVR